MVDSAQSSQPGLEGVVDLWQVVGTELPRHHHEKDPGT